MRILTGANVLSKQVSCKGVSSTRESPAKKLKIADPVGNGLLSSLRQATVRSGQLYDICIYEHWVGG